jgi:dolichol-phosphate mannosyltransferase
MRLLSIIIPCCNEGEAVPGLADALDAAITPLRDVFDVEVVLVDDGSTDDTWDQLLTLQNRPTNWTTVLVQHDHNRGLGAALRSGFARATGDVIVTIDADGTYPFSIIESLVGAVDSGADVATASPYHQQGHVEDVSGLRLFFSRGASLCYRVVVDRHIATYTAMVRAYRRPILAKTMSQDDGFLNVAMTLVEARRRGAVVSEVPATLKRRQVGRSKARLLQITRAHARYLAHLMGLRATFRFWLDDQQVQSPAGRHEVVKHG